MDPRAQAFVRRVKHSLASGMTMREVAEMEGIEYASVLQRLRRCGFRYDQYTREIVPTSQMPGKHIVNGNPLPARAVHVIERLRLAGSDPDEVARKFDFKNTDEMASYLKDHGMVWSTELNDYVPAVHSPSVEQSSEGTSDAGRLLNALSVLLAKLPEIDGSAIPPQRNDQKQGPVTIPRYRTRARRIPKSITMSISLQQMLEKVAQECNTTQSEVIEVAFVEFCMKYGYEEEIRMLLS